MYWHIEQFNLKVTHPLLSILIKFITDNVDILCRFVQWAVHLEINTPRMEGLQQIFHWGSVDIKYPILPHAPFCYHVFTVTQGAKVCVSAGYPTNSESSVVF